MAGQDFFARVALEHHPVGKDVLVQSPPLGYERHYLKSSTLVAARIVECSYAENLQRFQEHLAGLRDRYRPFMENHTPVPDLERPVTELGQFQFRYETSEDSDFSRVLEGKGQWEEVTIPDYRGPVGKWTGFYRREFVLEGQSRPGKRIFLRFLGVDYVARVYLNGRCVGSHEGFFAPFEFDVTESLRYHGDNVLVVEVRNDLPTLGHEVQGEQMDGDKLYAATGPGWDDPLEGWHHCPPGAGITNKVFLEERATLFIHALFARPDVDQSCIEAWVEVLHAQPHNQALDLRLSVYPRNFYGGPLADVVCRVAPAGPGVNYYRITLPLSKYRLWSPQEPWLYTLRASVVRDGRLEDQKDCRFGMRKFHMDEGSEPQGTLYLNNQPIILRGANEMGHLQQCVMRGDYDQLVEDILIAKLANMNYYRVTQRPVQEEIYDYFDMLGLMHQCDFPLFGYLRRNQFSEAVRQVGEMERLIRSHPSSIMVTFINEPFPIGKYEGQEEERLYVSYAEKGHRHLYRSELEAFFAAARQAILLENPDRVVKNVEGDYDPPTATGLSDFHCYTLWYTNHALPVGRLYKGHLPPLKRGWKAGCGEYGAEGLDNHDVMMKTYPKEWVPEDDDAEWRPDRIMCAQTHSMHGDWFEEQSRIKDWIRESQAHQAFATAIVTDALRRRSDVVVSSALHLLIDAWPSGWMKAVVGVDRVPKPAYFAFQKSLEPIRVNLRCDRWKAYGGETVEVEAWVLNDTPVDVRGYKVIATVRKAGQDYGSFEVNVDAKAVFPTYAGTIPVDVPEVCDRETLFVDAALLDAEGNVVNVERMVLEAFERGTTPCRIPVMHVGTGMGDLFEKLGVNVVPCRAGAEERPERIIISSWQDYRTCGHPILDWVAAGSRALFTLDGIAQDSLQVEGLRISLKDMNGLTFVARNAQEAHTREFGPQDFSFWYNEDNDGLDFIAERYIDCQQIVPLVFTYQKPEFSGSAQGPKRRLPVVGYVPYGRGELVLSTLRLRGFVGVNPVLDRFLKQLLGT